MSGDVVGGDNTVNSSSSNKTSVTLFVSRVPLYVTDRSFAAVFEQVNGFVTARLRTDRTRRVIGFVEYVDAASAALAKATLHGFKFPVAVAASVSASPPPPLDSSVAPAVGPSPGVGVGVGAGGGVGAPAVAILVDGGGIVIQYARPYSAAQMRELELLDAQHSEAFDVNGAAVEHDAAAESVALNSFGAAATIVQAKKKATLIAAATAAAAAANAVGVPVANSSLASTGVPLGVAPAAHVAPVATPVASPAPPPQTPPRFVSPPSYAMHRGSPHSAVVRTAALYNGPPPDEARLRALLDSGLASCTLFVEGLPLDATEREVSHIFRPFEGFTSLRLRPTVSKRDPSINFVLCFVEFQSPQLAAAALDARQGYQFASDTRTLKITFSNNRTPGTPINNARHHHPQ
jgi:hypothetical protein